MTFDDDNRGESDSYMLRTSDMSDPMYVFLILNSTTIM